MRISRLHGHPRKPIALGVCVTLLLSVLTVVLGTTSPAGAQVQRATAVSTISVDGAGNAVVAAPRNMLPVGASSDGSRVLFWANEGAPYTNGGARWLLKNVGSGALTQINRRDDGSAGPFFAGYQPLGEMANLLSSDGTLAAFSSFDPFIDSGAVARGSGEHIYVYNATTGDHVLAETNSAGIPVDIGGGLLHQLTWNGRYVLMDLVGANTGSAPAGATQYEASYIKDLQTGELTLVSVPGVADTVVSAGAYRNPVRAMGISDNADIVIYKLYSGTGVFMLQRSTGRTWPVSTNDLTGQDFYDLTPDGNFAVIHTYYPYAPGDQPNTDDDYRFDLAGIRNNQPSTPQIIGLNDSGSPTTPCGTISICHMASRTQLSDNGRFAAFWSSYPLDSTAQTTASPGPWGGVFVRDFADSSVVNMTHDAGGVDNSRVVFSGSGNAVVWTTGGSVYSRLVQATAASATLSDEDLVYTFEDSSGVHVHAVASNGSSDRIYFAAPTGQVQISPNRDQIYYSMRPHNMPFELHTYRVDGSGDRNLGQRVNAFRLSPDGTKIAKQGDGPPHPVDNQYHSYLAVANADGTGAQTYVFPVPGDVQDFTWSGDSKTVYMRFVQSNVTSTPSCPHPGFYVASFNTVTQAFTKLTPDDCSVITTPSVSLKTGQVAWFRNYTEVWVANRDGTHARMLTSVPANSINTFMYGSAWSPQGDRLAVVQALNSASGARGRIKILDVVTGQTLFEQPDLGNGMVGVLAWDSAPAPADTIAPNVNALVSPAPNGAGWNNTPVDITWVATDDSGTATQPAPSHVGVEGANQIVTSDPSCDPNGNCATGSKTISIDLTAPSITGTIVDANGATVPAPASGWYTSAVRVHWSCTDTLSGVATCSPDSYLSSDGSNQTVGGQASDIADNTATGSLSGISIDATAPSSTATTTCGTSTYCAGISTDVTLAATDLLSGVASIHAQINGGVEQVFVGASGILHVPLDSTSSTKVITYWAVDAAGNSERANTAVVAYDNVAPTITHTINPAPNAAGWNNTSLMVHWDAVDDVGGSGVASVSPDSPVVDETQGLTLTGIAVDNAGNQAQDPVRVKLDKTNPIIIGSVIGTQNAAHEYIGSARVHFTCLDPTTPGTSGIVSCPSDTVLTQLGAGQSVSGTTVDAAGNTADTVVAGITIVSATGRVAITNLMTQLNGLTLTGTNAANRRQAIVSLNNALTPGWWNSAGTAPGSSQGQQIFDELHNAVQSLAAITGTPVATQAMNSLLDMARQWATDAITAAIARGGSGTQINLANSKLQLGDTRRAANSVGDAMDAYRAAWYAAIRA